MENAEMTRLKPMHFINNRLYFNMKDAITLTGRSKRTLQRDMSRRKIQYLDYGNGKYFLPEWIDDYVERHVVHTKKFLKEAK